MTREARLTGEDAARLRAAAATVAAALACDLPEAVDWIARAAAELAAAEHQGPARHARRLLRLRPLRAELLDAPLFRDLAWNMLLDLFVREAEGKRVSVTSLTIASGGASTTALRHMDKLIEHGLIARTDDQADGRRSWVSLTADTRAAIATLLARMQDG